MKSMAVEGSCSDIQMSNSLNTSMTVRTLIFLSNWSMADMILLSLSACIVDSSPFAIFSASFSRSSFIFKGVSWDSVLRSSHDFSPSRPFFHRDTVCSVTLKESAISRPVMPRRMYMSSAISRFLSLPISAIFIIFYTKMRGGKVKKKKVFKA